MGADEISQLVQLADTFVAAKTGTPLEAVQTAILRSALEGAKLKDIRFSGYAESSIRRQIAPKLWKLLSELTGKKVTIKTVGAVLEELQREDRAECQVQRSLSELAEDVRSPQRAAVEICPGVAAQGLEQESRRQESVSARRILETKAFASLLQLDGYFRRGALALYKVADFWDGDRPEPEGRSKAKNDPPKASSQTPHASNRIFNLFNFILYTRYKVPILLAVAIASMLGFSWITNWCGANNHAAGQLPGAKFCYDLALKFFPNFAANPVAGAAHYNRGSYYEDVQDFASAKAEYQIAIDLGFIPAFNNRARLHVKDKNYEAAVSLLQQGLKLAANDDRLKYAMLKNLGWARLEQRRYAEAEAQLRQAIDIDSHQASAYCLLAQVQEKRKKAEALQSWETCLRYARTNNPDEDRWIEQAQQRLDGAD